MSYRYRTIKLSQLSRLRRMAAEGMCVTRASSAVGLDKRYVYDWARGNRVHFSRPASHGAPQWLMPELARQAENALRSLLGRVA